MQFDDKEQWLNEVRRAGLFAGQNGKDASDLFDGMAKLGKLFADDLLSIKSLHLACLFKDQELMRERKLLLHQLAKIVEHHRVMQHLEDQLDKDEDALFEPLASSENTINLKQYVGSVKDTTAFSRAIEAIIQ